jgi:DNA repair exonuclease SbcCD ATPase subunit
MHIERITLKNFGKHELLDVSLQTGLIGIFGANGSGKSTLVDAAYVALTNDWSRFEGVKTDNIRTGSEAKDESSIYLEGRHDGVKFQLLRSLRPNRNELTIDGVKGTITKANDIQYALEHQFGVDMRLIRSFVFVAQWELFSFMADTPGERAKTYQYLCNTGKAEQIVAECDKLLAQDRDLLAPVFDNTDELLTRIGANKEAMTEASTQLADVSRKIMPPETEKKAKAVVSKRETWDLLNDELVPKQQLLLARRNAKNAATSLAANRESLLKDLEELVEHLRPSANAAELALRQFKQFEANKARRSQLVAEQARHQHDLDELVPPRKPPVMTIRDAAPSREAFAEADTERKRLTKILRDFDSGNLTSCPTCGMPVEDLSSHLEHYREQVRELTETAAEHARVLEEIKQEREAVEGYNLDLRQYQNAKAIMTQALTSCQSELAALQELDEPDADKATLEADIAALKEQERNLVTARNLLRESVEASAKASAALTAVQERIVEIETGIKNATVSDELLVRAVKALELHTHATVEAAGLKERIRAFEASIKQDEAEIKKIKTRVEQGRKAREFAAMLQDVQSVMHRQALPQDVAQENLEDMEADINAVLAMFGNPFWIETASDLTFTAHFPGQPPIAAARLSGGQKSVLAVAFRTAVQSMFSDELGMLVLDEPTAGLDSVNVAYLAEAIARFAAELRGRRQVIMISHADALRSSFDQVIELS